MKIAYFNCSSGISGDMILGAFIDAGLPVSYLQKELKKLKISARGGSAFGGKNLNLHAKKVERGGLPGRLIDIKGKKVFSSTEEMVKVLKESKLAEEIKNKSIGILKNLIKAELKVHQAKSKSQIHLDQLASADTLVDIVGSCIALRNFEIDEVYASPINLGSPAPATLKLLSNLPVYSSKTNEELATPTGAAIISTVAKNFGSMPLMEIEKSGFGAGSKDLPERPNLLRLIIGNSLTPTSHSPMPRRQVAGEATLPTPYVQDKVLLLETNIDDMNPQIYPYVMEKLFKLGALDVWLTPVQMKKGRPGIVLNCLFSPNKKEEIVNLIFRETTTLGVRFTPWERIKLPRKIKKNSQKLTYKIASGLNFTRKKIEYREAEKIAKEKNIPLKKILS